MQARVTMRVDPTLDASAPALTQARVTRPAARRPRADGVARTARAATTSGRRATTELAAKFMSCATRALSEAQARAALAALREIESVADVRA